MPQDVLKSVNMTGLDFYVSGDNLFLLSQRDGFNPSSSISGASDTYRYSPMSTISIGLKAKFYF
jgi:hypothetical protein